MPSARRVRWAKFRVASVSIVALAILSTLIYLLTGGTLLEQKAPLYLYISDATGLSSDSPVRVNGILAGQVKKVELTGSNSPNRIVKVTVEIERDKLEAITKDSMTQLSTDTLVGDKYVDITSGKAPGHIAPNGELLFRPQPDMMRTIDFADFERQMRIVDSTLADIEQGRSPLGQFVLTDTVYYDLRKKFVTLQAAIDDAKKVTSTAGALIYTDALYRKWRDPFVQLDQKLALIQSGQGGFGKLLRDTAQYEQLRATASDLRKSIAGIETGDFIASDSAYVAGNRTVAKLIGQVDEFNASPLFSTSAIFDNVKGAADEMRKTIEQFREDPRKFLRLKVF